MNSPGRPQSSSPSYRHLKQTPKPSPVELKAKMRKDYKDRIQNCRQMLLSRMRGAESDVRDQLTEIYNSLFNFSNLQEIVHEESEVMEEIQRELIQEELEWWVQEHEKMNNIDWSILDEDAHVICFLCEKANLYSENGKVVCGHCKIAIDSDKSLVDLQSNALNIITKHNISCSSVPQFSAIAENNEAHVYMICYTCSDMCLLV